MASNIDHGVFKGKSYSRLKVYKGAFDEVKHFSEQDSFFMLITVSIQVSFSNIKII